MRGEANLRGACPVYRVVSWEATRTRHAQTTREKQVNNHRGMGSPWGYGQGELSAILGGGGREFPVEGGENH